ncbi:MAG TPA: hypothetical protein PKN57_02050 [Saprospiraceae bacterium]|nr:hypothetical protein [Saprospiraceae bacterium]HMZ73283.1 hypothetical protein [Saprospiraceae bacterium]HNE64556.1 hypothetical protein [Saprospiraceae bacterium]HNG12136.1 hypothetical protein [Saprospiraceae bacterium]HNJ16016.1 hypothetical protein [Saprospiraceae bacterium]
MMKYLTTGLNGIFLLLLLGVTTTGLTQNLNIPADHPANDVVERWLISNSSKDIHPAIRPFNRNDWAQLILKKKINAHLNPKDSTNLLYSMIENQDFINCDSCKPVLKSRKPLLTYFYKTPADLLEFKSDYFYLKLNPVFGMTIGKEKGNESNIFENSRGIELRGGIDSKVYFYSRILETQQRFENYITDRINRFNAVPGNGFYKNYNSSIFDVKNGFDFNNATAYIGFNVTKHIGAQFGYGNNFIGNGIRSLLLSDYSNNYLYFKLNTKVGRFHYQNIFGELQAAGARDDIGDVLIPKKYFAAHYLSYAINKNWHAGIFETVVFARKDHFDFQYLNPVILYRSVEAALGSPDNVLIGFNVSGNIAHTVQLYGQLMLDEFLFRELIKDNRGWWANKFGLQGGIKYINVLGVDHLDLQLEANLVMPYTYTHADSTASYTHYNQALAHPLGANLVEGIARVKYRILPNLQAECWLQHYKQGLDSNTSNWGENILTTNTSRVSDYGNKLLQGLRTNVTRLTFRLEWKFFHNMNAFGEYSYRRQTGYNEQTLHYAGAGFKINIGSKPLLL